MTVLGLSIVRTLKRLRAARLFVVTAIVTLTIGLSGTGVMCALVRGVLLRPLPFDDYSRLVSVRHSAKGLGLQVLGLSPATYLTYQDAGTSFEHFALWERAIATVSSANGSQSAEILNVTQSFLTTLRIQTTLGRDFTPGDDSPGAARRAIVSHAYWRDMLGGRTTAIGEMVTVDGMPIEIIGVLPAGFKFLDRNPALLLPCRLNPAEVVVGYFRYNGIARLRPGVTIDLSTREFMEAVPRIIHRFPMPPGYDHRTFEEMRLGAVIRPLADDITGPVRYPLLILLMCVAAMLAVASLNIAQLAVLRCESSAVDTATQLALGATRKHLALDALCESAWIVASALGISVAVVVVAIDLLKRSGSVLVRLEDVELDMAVILAMAAFALVALVIVAAPPLARSWRADARALAVRITSLRTPRHRAKRLIAMLEIAGAALLLVVTGSMAKTFIVVTRTDLGVRQPDRLLTLRIAIPPTIVKDPELTARTYLAIEERLRTIPGVEDIGLANSILLDGVTSRNVVYVDGFPGENGRQLRRFKWVSGGYFSTIGQPVIAGRALTWDDSFKAYPVALVSKNLAVEYWGDADSAIGKRVRRSPEGRWRTIVGVVGDVRDDGPGLPTPATAYWPLITMDDKTEELRISRSVVYAIRSTRANSSTFAEEIRREVAEFAPNLAAANVQTIDALAWQWMSQQRTSLAILAAASGSSLILAVLGIYAVVASVVSCRTPEIGLRLALGASKAHLLASFVKGTVIVAAVGIGLGLFSAWAATVGFSASLPQFARIETSAYVITAGLVGAMAVLATLVPAVRATRMDPRAAMELRSAR